MTSRSEAVAPMPRHPADCRPELAALLEQIVALVTRLAPVHPEIGRVPLRLVFDEGRALMTVGALTDAGELTVLETFVCNPLEPETFGQRVPVVHGGAVC